MAKADVFLTKDLEHVLFQLPNEVIISTVGHVPDIDAGEFRLLSGFTYFIGAWIEFEKSGRRLIETKSDQRRPVVGHEMLRILRDTSILSVDDAELAHSLSRQRNVVIHGDSTELPDKDAIDELVLITERLKGLEPLPVGAIPPRHSFRPRPST